MVGKSGGGLRIEPTGDGSKQSPGRRQPTGAKKGNLYGNDVTTN